MSETNCQIPKTTSSNILHDMVDCWLCRVQEDEVISGTEVCMQSHCIHIHVLDVTIYRIGASIYYHIWSSIRLLVIYRDNVSYVCVQTLALKQGRLRVDVG